MGYWKPFSWIVCIFEARKKPLVTHFSVFWCLHLDRPTTTSFRRRRDRDAESVEGRGADMEEGIWGVNLSLNCPIREPGERRKLPSGVRPEPRTKMDCMHIWGQKEATCNTFFSIFERRRPLKTSWGPGKLSLLPFLSTGLIIDRMNNWILCELQLRTLRCQLHKLCTTVL